MSGKKQFSRLKTSVQRVMFIDAILSRKTLKSIQNSLFFIQSRATGHPDLAGLFYE